MYLLYTCSYITKNTHICTVLPFPAPGAEATMPAVESIFTTASAHGITNIVIGMPHRGRLNLLVSLLEYPSRYVYITYRTHQTTNKQTNTQNKQTNKRRSQTNKQTKTEKFTTTPTNKQTKCMK